MTAIIISIVILVIIASVCGLPMYRMSRNLKQLRKENESLCKSLQAKVIEDAKKEKKIKKLTTPSKLKKELGDLVKGKK